MGPVILLGAGLAVMVAGGVVLGTEASSHDTSMVPGAGILVAGAVMTAIGIAWYVSEPTGTSARPAFGAKFQIAPHVRSIRVVPMLDAHAGGAAIDLRF
jgi:hypothetical protein